MDDPFGEDRSQRTTTEKRVLDYFDIICYLFYVLNRMMLFALTFTFIATIHLCCYNFIRPFRSSVVGSIISYKEL